MHIPDTLERQLENSLVRKKEKLSKHSSERKENDEVQDTAQENRLQILQEGEERWRRTSSSPTSQETNYNHKMTSTEGRKKLEPKPAKEQQDNKEDTHVPDTLERQIENLLRKMKMKKTTQGGRKIDQGRKE